MSGFNTRIRAKFTDVERGREDLHGYQNTAVQFAREHPFSMLMLDLGLGKSISSLTLISDLVLDAIDGISDEGEKVLVIAPLRVATDVWPTEIRLWRHTAWMNATLIRDDGRRTKEDCARDSATIHIINREQVEWLVYFWKDQWPYRTVIIDESDSFKDHNSKRFKALTKTRNTDGLIKRLHCLSATPASESYIELFPQFYLLDKGKRLGKNITAYRNSHFTFNQYKHKYILNKGEEERILAKIADITLVMKAKDYLPRTEATIIRRPIKLDQKQHDMIKSLEKHFILTLPDGTEIEAKTAAMLASMLLQMASGTVYETFLEGDYETEDLKKVKKVHHIHDYKLDALKEMYEEAKRQKEPLLVTYFWQSSLARLRKAFPDATVMDKDAKCVGPWNAGKIPMLLIHPMSAGHGLNLQKGPGHIMVMYDLIFSLRYYLQTIGRLDRQGQKNPVLVYLLVAQGTRDEVVADALVKKEDAQDKLFSILKRLIRKLKKQDATC